MAHVLVRAARFDEGLAVLATLSEAPDAPDLQRL